MLYAEAMWKMSRHRTQTSVCLVAVRDMRSSWERARVVPRQTCFMLAGAAAAAAAAHRCAAGWRAVVPVTMLDILAAVHTGSKSFAVAAVIMCCVSIRFCCLGDVLPQSPGNNTSFGPAVHAASGLWLKEQDWCSMHSRCAVCWAVRVWPQVYGRLGPVSCGWMARRWRDVLGMQGWPLHQLLAWVCEACMLRGYHNPTTGWHKVQFWAARSVAKRASSHGCHSLPPS
jgi:hypothetical protein